MMVMIMMVVVVKNAPTTVKVLFIIIIHHGDCGLWLHCQEKEQPEVFIIRSFSQLKMIWITTVTDITIKVSSYAVEEHCKQIQMFPDND
jgi:hypothetical protein